MLKPMSFNTIDNTLRLLYETHLRISCFSTPFRLMIKKTHKLWFPSFINPYLHEYDNYRYAVAYIQNTSFDEPP